MSFTLGFLANNCSDVAGGGDAVLMTYTGTEIWVFWYTGRVILVCERMM